MIKLSSCCLLRAHQGLLVGGAGRDLRVGDPPVLHAEREGAVGGDHWEGRGQPGHDLRVGGGQDEACYEDIEDQHLGRLTVSN